LEGVATGAAGVGAGVGAIAGGIDGAVEFLAAAGAGVVELPLLLCGAMLGAVELLLVATGTRVTFGATCAREDWSNTTRVKREMNLPIATLR
jgi:hypothetical protein